MQGSQAQQQNTIKKITQSWQSLAPVYLNFDSCMQTFYYTLINMMELNTAKHVLEVACGTGKLLTYAVEMKNQETTYLATDLSQKMVQYSQKNIEKSLGKVGVTKDVKEWMEEHKLELRAANGEEKIESPYKFDRIIANLVINLTEDPIKMMTNLYQMSSENCLLGVTIWGNKQYSNLFTIMPQAMKNFDLVPPKSRTNFHLYNKLSQLAKRTNWQIVVQWQQNAPLHFIRVRDQLKQFVNYWCRADKRLQEYHMAKIEGIFGEKKVLNFPCQLAILRKQKQ